MSSFSLTMHYNHSLLTPCFVIGQSINLTEVHYVDIRTSGNIHKDGAVRPRFIALHLNWPIRTAVCGPSDEKM